MPVIGDRTVERRPSSLLVSRARAVVSDELSTRPTLSWRKGVASDSVTRPSEIPREGQTLEQQDSDRAAAHRTTLELRAPNSNETDESEIRVKGINFTVGLEALQRIYGTAARRSIEKKLPGAAGEALRFGGLVIGGWYPVSWYRDFWNAAEDVFDADEAAARRVGKLATEISVNVAYRALARMTSPKMLLAMSARAFGHYFQQATLVVTHPLPNRLTAKWRNCDGFNSMIWHVVEGGCMYFIEATGAKDVTFSVVSGGDSANHMLANLTWR